MMLDPLTRAMILNSEHIFCCSSLLWMNNGSPSSSSHERCGPPHSRGSLPTRTTPLLVSLQRNSLVRANTRTSGRLWDRPHRHQPPLASSAIGELRREINISNGVGDAAIDAASATLDLSADVSGMASMDIAGGAATTSKAETS